MGNLRYFPLCDWMGSRYIYITNSEKTWRWEVINFICQTRKMSGVFFYCFSGTVFILHDSQDIKRVSVKELLFELSKVYLVYSRDGKKD